MKVTISNTSMMKPILYTQPNAHSENNHPQRILGLLERTGNQPTDDPVFIYRRPNNTNSDATPYQWQRFLHISDSRAQSCAAVFGFEFDGVHTWYQLWDTKYNQPCWLLHEDNMDYQPYAIMAMDALVSLVPDLNGELYMYLSATNDSGDALHQTNSLPSTQVSRHYDLLISDAATTSNGELWFLVTVKDVHTESCNHTHFGQMRTGWISQRRSIACAA